MDFVVEAVSDIADGAAGGMIMGLEGDEGAAPSRALDQALDLEPLQSDAHGGAADIQMARKLRFGGDALAVLPAASDDQPPQLVVQLNVQRNVAVVIQPDLGKFIAHKDGVGRQKAL